MFSNEAAFQSAVGFLSKSANIKNETTIVLSVFSPKPEGAVFLPSTTARTKTRLQFLAYPPQLKSERKKRQSLIIAEGLRAFKPKIRLEEAVVGDSCRLIF